MSNKKAARAHTVSMGKKFIHLIPATLIFLLSACQTNGETKLNENFLNKNNGEYVTEEPFPSTPKAPSSPPLQMTEDGYWITENADVSEIDKTRKLIALTFDDTPSRTLERILAVFAAFNEENPDCKATATLFVNGGLLDNQNLHLLHVAHAMGFELGNHTQSHADLTKLNRERLITEIATTDELLSKVDGQTLHLLRAPFGRTNELVKEIAPTPLIDWTIDTLDWTGIDGEEIFSRVWEGRFSGAISLMHDGYEGTVYALKRLLPALKEDGYQVVSLSKMIELHGCRFQKGKTYIRARKQK